ncbi:MAG TPA: ionic transporter y4hA [Burkholderiaceae bacterium]|jgi:Ca2+:H+ antiporter|nr:ionic transporter y4hA [Burkholderiaceae bacterium]
MLKLRKLLFNASTWNAAVPVLACLLLAAVWERSLGWALLALVVAALIAAVAVAVHHAEVIALRVGEPFGTLVLALAVTVIETSLIVALMLSGGAAASALARDTVFATVMIVCNGVVGLCLLAGALRHHVLAFRVEGTAPALSVLATLASLVLVLPNFTSSTPGPTLSPSQLVFAGIVSLTLYAVFVFVQTVRHREYFLPVELEAQHPAEAHGVARPSVALTMASLALLLLSLVAVVGLAKTLAPSIERMVVAAGVPHAVIGIAIALMVLLPETWAAVRAALRNRMQVSLNLALGSALATIGLTIPAVAVTSLALGLPLDLGLPDKEVALLALTLLIATMTLSRGLATVLQAAVHLVLFAVFLFLAIVP